MPLPFQNNKKLEFAILSLCYIFIITTITFGVGFYFLKPRTLFRQTKYKSHFVEQQRISSIATVDQLQPNQIVKTDKELYKDYFDNLKKLTLEQNPQAALSLLAQDFSTNLMVQNKCHSLSHVIGNAALTKYNNDTKKALSAGQDTCGGGYVHGVIEKILAQSQNPEEEILKICDDENQGCFHGIGHGIMIYKNNNPDQSVALCQKFQADVHQIRCGEGVFMELFDSENASDDEKPALNVSDPTKICNHYPAFYRNSCYFYASRYVFRVTKDPINTLDKCLDYQSYDIAGCIKGASSGIVRSILKNPGAIEEYCDVVMAYLDTCYQGAIDYHLFILGDQKQTETNLCGKFEDAANQLICKENIMRSEFRK
jgi:hypothetical protein